MACISSKSNAPMTVLPRFVQHDGGRKESGKLPIPNKRGYGDCVVRAVAIAAGLHYNDVWNFCTEHMISLTGYRDADRGVVTRHDRFKAYMRGLGFEWVPTMSIGSGCRVHLRADELPPGRLAVRVSGHYVAVINGVIFDTYDCSRDGTRCVYGYWILKHAEPKLTRITTCMMPQGRVRVCF